MALRGHSITEQVMIPIIEKTDTNKDADVLEAVNNAYTSIGFAVWDGSWLTKAEKQLMDDWRNMCGEFFENSIDYKQQYIYDSETNLGYTGWGKENVDPSAPKDMKESFNYNDTRMPAEQWPDMPGFKETALKTIKLADRVTSKVLLYFDRILERPDMPISRAHAENFSTTRVIHYPPYDGPIENRQMRIGEHSDYGTITLLWQFNDVPGLEVQDLEGAWHPVPFVENGIVINIGDLLQRWSNDYFKSTKHRVVNSHMHLPRYSMPHFVDPTPGTIVKNLREHEQAKYPEIESLEYLKWRLAQSY